MCALCKHKKKLWLKKRERVQPHTLHLPCTRHAARVIRHAAHAMLDVRRCVAVADGGEAATDVDDAVQGAGLLSAVHLPIDSRISSCALIMCGGVLCRAATDRSLRRRRQRGQKRKSVQQRESKQRCVDFRCALHAY